MSNTSTILLYFLLFLAILFGCTKTIILNRVEEEQEQTETKADTTETETPPAEDADTLHEITFQPIIEAWVISQGDTLKV